MTISHTHTAPQELATERQQQKLFVSKTAMLAVKMFLLLTFRLLFLRLRIFNVARCRKGLQKKKIKRLHICSDDLFPPPPKKGVKWKSESGQF